jgi:hypothetical protein
MNLRYRCGQDDPDRRLLARTVDAVAAIFAATPPVAKGAPQNLSS